LGTIRRPEEENRREDIRYRRRRPYPGVYLYAREGHRDPNL